MKGTRKRSTAWLTAALMVCATLAVVPEAWARAGGGGSSGSRGSRSYSAPVKPSPMPSSPAAPAAPTAPPSARPTPPQPQRSGWSGLMGGLGGFVLGGLLGSLLFGGLGHGMGGGFGMLELIVLGVLAYLAFSWFRRRQAAASASSYTASASYGAPTWAERGTATVSPPELVPAGPASPADADLAQGLDHIRQVDGGFDPRAFAERAAEIFRDVQSAWTRQDLSVVAGVLTPEMQAQMSKDAEGFRTEGKVNHLDQIAVRSAEVTEAWQEKGQDFVTVRFEASLIDYTTDRDGKIVDGNPNEPIAFEEFWTFTRPVWAKSWRLSAIQQPAGR